MVLVCGVPEAFKLRWRFVYFDGKPDRFGAWSRAGDQSTMAAYAPKEYLSKALVEGKNIRTGKTRVFFEIPGEDYINFEWIGAIRANPFSVKGEQTYSPEIIGCIIHSREMVYSVSIAGAMKRRPRTEEEKKRHYFTFGGNK
jgi:hypothetical protein